MKLASWPLPTDEQLSSWNGGFKGRAIIEYRKTIIGELSDGTKVRPHLKTIKQIFGVAEMLPGAHLAIETDSYEVYNAEREAGLEALNRLKWERFKAFCKEDGHDGTERGHRYCRECGPGQPGVIHYQPDLSGYPTEVMFHCDTHNGWS